jgi:tetratricopeptide (TPR) repeat protein
MNKGGFMRVALFVAALSLSVLSSVVPALSADSEDKGFTPPPFPFHNKGGMDAAPKLSATAQKEWDEGEKSFRAMNYKLAAQNFQKVAELEPKFELGHVRYGSALAASGNYDDAKREIDKAIELAPRDYLAHLVLGRIILVKSGEDAGAVEAQRAYDLNPWNCAAFLEFANKEQFEPHRWFVLANYWREMKSDAAASTNKKNIKAEACCPECAKKGMNADPEACKKKAAGKTQ